MARHSAAAHPPVSPPALRSFLRFAGQAPAVGCDGGAGHQQQQRKHHRHLHLRRGRVRAHGCHDTPRRLVRQDHDRCRRHHVVRASKKSDNIFRVGVFLDQYLVVIRLTTRAPHGAHVRRTRQNRIDRRSGLFYRSLPGTPPTASASTTAASTYSTRSRREPGAQELPRSLERCAGLPRSLERCAGVASQPREARRSCLTASLALWHMTPNTIIRLQCRLLFAV